MGTQSELVTYIRDMLDESNARQWSDQQLRSWINDGAIEISRKTECTRAEASINTTASTGEYTLTQNIVRLHMAEWQSADGQLHPLEFRDRHSMSNLWWNDPSSESHAPVVITHWGNPPALKIQLYPVPSQSGTLKIFYYSFPERLAENNTTDGNVAVDLPAGWDDMLVDYAEYRALRRDRDERWQEAYQLWLEKLSDLTTASTRYNDQAGQVDWQGNPGWLTAWDW